jgi:cholesterol transport system auxiliary component
MNNTRRQEGALSLIAATLFLASCATTRPVHYYTLAEPVSQASQSKPDGPVILVGAIDTPEYLQDERIRYRAGAHESGTYEYHRWRQRPGMIVRDALVGALRASGKYRRVSESSSIATGDYLVRGRLREFGEVDDTTVQTRVSLDLELIDKQTNRVVWDHFYDHHQPAGGKSMTDVVGCMDQNLSYTVRQAAADIGAFLATPH